MIESIDYLDEQNKAEIKAEDNKIMPEPEVEEVKIKKVYLQFDITNQTLVNTLHEIISGYEGKSPVLVQYNKKIYPLGCFVEPSNALVAEISRVIGQSNIKII